MAGSDSTSLRSLPVGAEDAVAITIREKVEEAVQNILEEPGALGGLVQEVSGLRRDSRRIGSRGTRGKLGRGGERERLSLSISLSLSLRLYPSLLCPPSPTAAAHSHCSHTLWSALLHCP